MYLKCPTAVYKAGPYSLLPEGTSAVERASKPIRLGRLTQSTHIFEIPNYSDLLGVMAEARDY